MKDTSKNWKITNRFVFLTFLSTLILSVLSPRVIAKDPGICFMIAASGKTISLEKLCSAKIADNKITQVISSATLLKEKDKQIEIITKNPTKKIIRIPIKRRIGRTPVIAVTFNNKQTFDMILDTGANSTLITNKMANKLQIKSTGKVNVEIADGSKIKFLTGRIKSIKAGGVVTNNVQVAIAPKASIGLLGHDFFGNYDIKLLANEVEFHHR